MMMSWRRLAHRAKTRYLVYVRIGEPAHKHGIPDADIWHAVRNAITGFELGELTMIIGASRDGTLLEIGILGESGDDPWIVHAMPLRSGYRKYL
jgi:hypothetical protein